MSATEAEVEISMEKAGAGARFVSYILDSVVLGILSFVLEVVFRYSWYADYVTEPKYFIFIYISLTPLVFLSILLITAGYFTYFFGNGQTLGMKALKLNLCGTDGTCPIGYMKGFVRWIGMIISGLVIGLGFFWILIDKSKQGWHDKIAKTYVVVGN